MHNPGAVNQNTVTSKQQQTIEPAAFLPVVRCVLHPLLLLAGARVPTIQVVGRGGTPAGLHASTYLLAASCVHSYKFLRKGSSHVYWADDH